MHNLDEAKIKVRGMSSSFIPAVITIVERSEKLHPSVRIITKDSIGDDSTKVSYTFKQVEDEVGGKKRDRWRYKKGEGE